ncbi:MAG: hypothetical protein LBH70_01935 [Spirochaetaceae bacterium]|nr:hypothetical protein [Spirochaetaceae bacterium]
MKFNAEPDRKRPRAQRKADLLRFAVLVPHRDSRRLLDARRRSLFAAGLLGAWSFPSVAPLARLSRPLAAQELKSLAALLGKMTMARGRRGMFVAGQPVEVSCPGAEEALRFWGPVLDPNPSRRIWQDIRVPAETGCNPFPLAVLCAALTPDGIPAGLSLPAPLPVFSFRAAAVANMIFRPLAQGAAGFSFRWKIGPLFWLPKKRAVTVALS